MQVLYENSSNADLLDSQLRKSLETTVGVRQDCLLSPILFNLFLCGKHFMTTTNPSPLVVGPYATYQFADDIDFMGGRNG